MARSSTTAFDSQLTANNTIALPVISIGDNYSVYSDAPQETVINNCMSSVDPTLLERISFKYRVQNASDFDLTRMYDRSSKKSYQVTITDAFIQRTTETDGTVHDDPVKVWFSFEAPRGSNIIDGATILGFINRIYSAAAMQTGDEFATTYLDRLMRGSTKPSVLV